jgi:hypothetical protein
MSSRSAKPWARSSGILGRLPVIAALVIMLVLGLGLAAHFTSTALGATRGPQRVYTIAQVVSRLHRDPAAWTGRTLVVRGMAVIFGCPLGVGVCGCAG